MPKLLQNPQGDKPVTWGETYLLALGDPAGFGSFHNSGPTELIQIERPGQILQCPWDAYKDYFRLGTRSVRRLKSKAENEFRSSPHICHTAPANPDTAIVPGSECLNYVSGSGITWSQFRTDKVHAANLKTTIYDSLVAGNGIPAKCLQMMRATMSLTDRGICRLVDFLVMNLQVEGASNSKEMEENLCRYYTSGSSRNH